MANIFRGKSVFSDYYLFQYQASNIMNSHLKDAPVLSIYYQMRGGVVKAGEALTRTKTDVFTQGTAEELLD